MHSSLSPSPSRRFSGAEGEQVAPFWIGVFCFLRLTLEKILIFRSPQSRRALSLMVSTGNSTASARTEPTVPLSALAKTDTFRCLGVRRENVQFHKKRLLGL